MLMPKRTKYRKQHKGRIRGDASSGTKISFGDFGMVSTESGLITQRQLEAARRALARAFKRVGKIFIRIFPDKPITKKPLEVRMGKGKGSVEYWAAVVKPGKVIFEISGVTDQEVVHKAFRSAGFKLPVKTKFKKRDIL